MQTPTAWMPCVAQIDVIEDQPDTSPHWDGGCLGILAVLVRGRFGLAAGMRRWFIPPTAPIQVGYIHLKVAEKITPHKYSPLNKKPTSVGAVLYIRKGRCHASFYGVHDLLAQERWLEQGDLLVHVAGGWGFEALEECELYEVKSGPYPGEGLDKIRITPEGR